VIVGAGPAGTACAETLRREGYAGPITLLGAEPPGPVDRPNLSKDYLAGTAPEEWMPLRTQEALGEEKIELVVDDPVSRITPSARTVTLTSGRTLSWGALVLAVGAEPVVLPIEGAQLPHVHTLRTLADARAIIADLAKAKRAVVIGASFIGLEAAASLRKRGLDVTVVGPEATPLARILGDEVGRFVREVHEENGVVFKLGRTPARITSSEVVLSDGSALPADVVVVGVGVRPRTKLAEEAGLRVDNGVVVDESFRASLPDVYAVGDVARHPYDGELVRIEHFAVAERHGQAVARTLAGRGAPYRDVPFFWSQHHDVTLAYVGHAQSFDAPEVHGSLKKRDAIVAYRRGGRVRAVLTVGRDRASLDAELALRNRDEGDAKAIEALLR
jgi:NADPH-dependent 2,4-dienoyl-CoA reductase/sulfur reductase-like enzyme